MGDRTARTYRTQKARAIATHAALICLSLIFLIPLFWLISSSFKTDAQLFQFPPKWIPNPVTLENYPKGLQFIPFGRYLTNTLIICLCSVLGSLLSCSLVAYGLACVRWPARKALFLILLSTMMLPPQVTMIPMFVVFAKLHWVDTFLPLIVPHFFGGAFYVFLMRKFFLSLPRELIDAAQLPRQTGASSRLR